ncbi:MAG: hypothetical protein MUO92_04900 [Dehalococcoidales bacterium]|nr:hypothetical protein [Dehalococcoidales bacterium]
MSSKLFRLKITVILVTAICLTIVLLAPSTVLPATTYRADSNGAPLVIEDFSIVPQPIVNDAVEAAAELFGNDQQKQNEFIGQLLARYLEAKDKDIVIINNSGGWGWSPIEAFPHGHEFVTGIDTKLNSLGYDTLWLDHYRTAKTLNGYVSELMLASDIYTMKAEDLAARVEFLTSHIPNISIILTGESNGSTICGDTMQILKDNPQVYSIQLGPPFWNNGNTSDRVLILRSNGSVPDAFSQGDVITIIRSNLEALFGISQEFPGHILFYIGAPGHDYSWQYEGVSSKVLEFLDNNFNTK